MENLLSLTLQQIKAAAAAKSLSCESGSEAFKYASTAPKAVPFEAHTLHKGEIFTVPSTTSDAWISTSLRPDGKPICRAVVTVKSSVGDRGFELFLGTLTKSVRDKDGNTVAAQIIDLDGNRVTFDTCVYQGDCWKVLQNRTFKVASVHEVPILKTNRDTGAQWASTTFVYDFQEIKS